MGGSEIISGNLSQVTETCGLLHIDEGHHRCIHAFENKQSSLIRALTPYSAVTADGDLNNDGQVNAVDVLLAQRILTGSLPLTPSYLYRGDVAPLLNGVPNSDGLFNLGDVLVIQRKALGLVDF